MKSPRFLMKNLASPMFMSLGYGHITSNKEMQCLRDRVTRFRMMSPRYEEPVRGLRNKNNGLLRRASMNMPLLIV